MKKIHLVLAFYVLLYVLLYFLAYNPNLIDGDDASTILYHLCGRNDSVQSPYAVYNSGFDYFLSYFEPDGTNIRNVALSVSFLFGLIALSLCAIFVDMVAPERLNGKYLFLGLIPLIIPDFLFHSLILNPTNVSFSFALAGLILYVRFLREKRWWLFAASVICVALAIPFRWSMLTIFPLFYALQWGVAEFNGWKNFKLTAAHSVASILLAAIFLAASGYGPEKFYQTILWGQDFMEQAERSMLSMLATGTAFFTIPMLALVLTGLISRFRDRSALVRNLSFVGLPLLPFVLLGFFPAFKFFISVIPILLVIMLGGFHVLQQWKWPKYALLVTIAGMWFVGLKIDAAGTLAGPGFTQSFEGKATQSEVSERNLDTRVKIKEVYPAFSGGFYMPMLEGPRPLFGYFHVLFAGGWSDAVQSFTDERKTALQLVKKNKATYLQDRATAFFQCDLMEAGYRTNSPFKSSGDFLVRPFYTATDTINVWIIPDGVPKNEIAIDYLKKHENTVFRSSYSSSILAVTQSIGQIEILGPYSVYKSAQKPNGSR